MWIWFDSFIMGRFFSISLFVFAKLTVYGQVDSTREFINHPPRAFSWTLMLENDVIDATVTNIWENGFELKIHETIIGNRFLDNRIKFQRRFGYDKEWRVTRLKLVAGARYLFFVSQTDHFPWERMIISCWKRFLIENDSLYIHHEVLQQISFPASIDIKQINTFNDMASDYGYKIALSDFKALIKAMDEVYEMGEHLRISKRGKKPILPGEFETAVIAHADSLWLRQNGTKMYVNDYSGIFNRTNRFRRRR
jgi:hypothetical protein